MALAEAALGAPDVRREIAEKAFRSRDGRPVYSQIADGPRVEHRSPASLFHAIRNANRAETTRTLVAITVHYTEAR